jgi:hypothetical protein
MVERINPSKERGWNVSAHRALLFLGMAGVFPAGHCVREAHGKGYVAG